MLELRLGLRPGRVELASEHPALRRLQTRYASAFGISQHAFDVDLEDFLTNLDELFTWPDDDVRWDRALLALVETNAADAATADGSIGTDPGAVGTVDLAVFREAGWIAPLTDFQLRDLNKMAHLAHNANFSVPGAGKTRATLALFHLHRLRRQAERLLVVAPKSAFESWRYEASVCFERPPVVGVMDSEVVPPADMLIVNYERLPQATPQLVRWLRERPSLLVLDEAHRMKLGTLGAWGSACMTLAPNASRRAALTGTPAPNGVQDLENILSFVWPGQGRAAVQRATASGNLRDASRMLRPLFVRTTKQELNLPPMEVAVRRLEMVGLHRELYDAVAMQQSVATRPGGGDLQALGRIVLYLLMAATSPALLARGASRHDPLPYQLPPLQVPPNSSLGELLRDLPNFELAPKYREVVAIVAANAEAGRKTLVWSTFVRNLTTLERLLGRFNPAVVHGGVEDRDAQIRRFRESSSCTVLLSNPATLGEGISLHHVCHDAVYLDRDFAAGRFLQSLDRIHRLGLAPDVTTRVTVLVSEATIDEVVEQRLADKLRFMGGVLDDPAVRELGDLDEEISISAGLASADVAALVGHLSSHAPG